MLSETEFRDKATEAIEKLEDRVQAVADEHDFEIESAEGILTFTFSEPSPAKFIVSPNSPARQIWVSALSTSYKFDWDSAAGSFVLDKTREPFLQVMANLIGRHLNTNISL